MSKSKISTNFEICLVEVGFVPENFSNKAFVIEWKVGSKKGKTKLAMAAGGIVRFSEILLFQESIIQEKNGICESKCLELLVYNQAKSSIFVGQTELDLAELCYQKGETAFFELFLHKSVSLPLATIKVKATAEPQSKATASNPFSLAKVEVNLMEDGRVSPMPSLWPDDGRTSPLHTPQPSPTSFELATLATLRQENEQLRMQIAELQEKLANAREEEMVVVAERDALRMKVESFKTDKEKEKEKGNERDSDADSKYAALRLQLEKENKAEVEAERARLQADLEEITNDYRKLMEQAAEKAAQDVWRRREKGKEKKK